MFIVHSPAWCPADTSSAVDSITLNIKFLKPETLKNEGGLQEPVAHLAQRNGKTFMHKRETKSLQETSCEKQAAVTKVIKSIIWDLCTTSVLPGLEARGWAVVSTHESFAVTCNNSAFQGHS